MGTPKNLKFPKGDARRALYVMLALHESNGGLTLNQLAAITGYFKSNLVSTLKSFEQFGVVLEKEDFVYRISDWGPILKKTGLKELLVSGGAGSGDENESSP